MEHSFTLNNLVRQAYKELSEAQCIELKSLEKQFPEISREKVQIAHLQDILEQAMQKPSRRSLENILEYSRHGRGMKV